MVNLNKLARECNRIADSKGWHEEHRTVGDLIALMHSELSEALEEFRAGHGLNDIYYDLKSDTPDKPLGFSIEYADTIIRILHHCAKENINIQEAFDIKMAYNKTRSHRHGGKLI